MLVSEDKVSRGKWPLPRVTEVHPGRGSLVRTATVRAEKNVLNRPLQHLHRLEMASATPQMILEDSPVETKTLVGKNVIQIFTTDSILLHLFINLFFKKKITFLI